MKKWLALLLCLLMIWPAASMAENTASGFTPIPWDAAVMPYAPHDECYLPNDTGYHDDSLDIRIETFRAYETTVTAAYVTLADASQLRTATAGSSSKTSSRIHRVLKRVNGVMAINGDYFGFHSQGIVIRNTKKLRDKPNVGRDELIIDENGDFTIITQPTRDKFYAFEGTVVHSFCFGPGLVVDGVKLASTADVVLSMAKDKPTQRIAFCQMGPLQYLILTCEGPENPGSVGLTLQEMADLCYEMGAVNAYNLDGGSSSNITMKDHKINSLSSGKERDVGDIIFFATLVP